MLPSLAQALVCSTLCSEEALAVPRSGGSFQLGRAWWAPADELQQLWLALSQQMCLSPCRCCHALSLEQPSKVRASPSTDRQSKTKELLSCKPGGGCGKPWHGQPLWDSFLSNPAITPWNSVSLPQPRETPH